MDLEAFNHHFVSQSINENALNHFSVDNKTEELKSKNFTLFSIFKMKKKSLIQIRCDPDCFWKWHLSKSALCVMLIYDLKKNTFTPFLMIKLQKNNSKLDFKVKTKVAQSREQRKRNTDPSIDKCRPGSTAVDKTMKFYRTQHLRPLEIRFRTWAKRKMKNMFHMIYLSDSL